MSSFARRMQKRAGRRNSGLFPPAPHIDTLPPHLKRVMEEIVLACIQAIPADSRASFGCHDEERFLAVTKDMIAKGWVRLVEFEEGGFKLELAPAADEMYHAVMAEGGHA